MNRFYQAREDLLIREELIGMVEVTSRATHPGATRTMHAPAPLPVQYLVGYYGYDKELITENVHESKARAQLELQSFFAYGNAPIGRLAESFHNLVSTIAAEVDDYTEGSPLAEALNECADVVNSLLGTA